MPPNELSKAFRSFTYSKDTFLPQTSNLLVESPLEIVINREKHILIMFTPEMTRELVIGFIFTDGLKLKNALFLRPKRRMVARLLRLKFRFLHKIQISYPVSRQRGFPIQAAAFVEKKTTMI